jgi:hypothetical protein
MKLRMPKSDVLKHLEVLWEARFANTKRAGKEVYHSINYEQFAEVGKLIKNLPK